MNLIASVLLIMLSMALLENGWTAVGLVGFLAAFLLAGIRDKGGANVENAFAFLFAVALLGGLYVVIRKGISLAFGV